jgi:hypothetical protein
MHSFSLPKGAGDWQKRGDFMFVANCSARGVPDTAFDDPMALTPGTATGVFRAVA